MSAEPKTLSLTGQTALVTGAAHGFGRAIAKTLADAGATVWGGDVMEAELAETDAKFRSMLEALGYA